MMLRENFMLHVILYFPRTGNINELVSFILTRILQSLNSRSLCCDSCGIESETNSLNEFKSAVIS